MKATLRAAGFLPEHVGIFNFQAQREEWEQATVFIDISLVECLENSSSVSCQQSLWQTNCLIGLYEQPYPAFMSLPFYSEI